MWTKKTASCSTPTVTNPMPEGLLARIDPDAVQAFLTALLPATPVFSMASAITAAGH